MKALAGVMERTRPAPTGFLPMTKLSTATATPWERLEADHDYFVGVLKHLFECHGYQVQEVRVHLAPRREEARACGFVLPRSGQRCLGLGLRQDLLVTSDVVGRLGRTLKAAQFDAGLLITTCFFSEGARQAARGLQITLYDRCQLWDLLGLK
jgi:hypothetical protein